MSSKWNSTFFKLKYSYIHTYRYKLKECSKTGNVGLQGFKTNAAFFNSVEGNFDKIGRSLEADVKWELLYVVCYVLDSFQYWKLKDLSLCLSVRNLNSIKSDLDRTMAKLNSQRQEYRVGFVCIGSSTYLYTSITVMWLNYQTSCMCNAFAVLQL